MILVTGATGTNGRPVVRALLAAGCGCAPLSRTRGRVRRQDRPHRAPATRGGGPLRPPPGRTTARDRRPLRRDEGGPGRLLRGRMPHDGGGDRVRREDPPPRRPGYRGLADVAE